MGCSSGDICQVAAFWGPVSPSPARVGLPSLLFARVLPTCWVLKVVMKRGALKEEEKGQLRERAFVGAVITMNVSMVTKAGWNTSRTAITHSQLEASRERVQRRTKTLQPCLRSCSLAYAS